jgi:hypothetical protein
LRSTLTNEEQGCSPGSCVEASLLLLASGACVTAMVAAQLLFEPVSLTVLGRNFRRRAPG